MEELNLLGEEVRRLRLRKKLTQGQLAKKIGASTNTISSIEIGKHIPRSQLLQDLANFFEIPLDRFSALASGRKAETQDDNRSTPKFFSQIWDKSSFLTHTDSKFAIFALVRNAVLSGACTTTELVDVI